MGKKLTRNQRKERHRRIEYQKRRRALIQKLGGRCVDCGQRRNLKRNPLTFDHLEPREWDVKQYSQWRRIKMYEREAANGILVVRCFRCNARKGPPAGFSKSDREFAEQF